MTRVRKKKVELARGESRPNFLVLFLIGIFPLLFVELVPIPVLDTFEWIVFDAQMRLRNTLAPREINDSIIIVGVGEADAQRLDDDLTNRQAYMELMARMRKWKASTVTFDIFFADEKATDSLMSHAVSSNEPPIVLAYHFNAREPAYQPTGAPPSEMAPYLEMARDSHDAPGLADAVMQFDDYLLQLREIDPTSDLREDERAGFHHNIAWTREIRGLLLRRWFWLTQGKDVVIPATARPYEAKDVGLIAPQIMLKPAILGFANVEKGGQDVVREAPLVYLYHGRIFPHLSLATALAHYGVPFNEVEVEWGKELRFTPSQNGKEDVRIPIDSRGVYLVNFREGEPYLERNPALSSVILPEFAEQVFRGDPAARFRDSFVIVGEVIAGGGGTDMEPIPLESQFPMVGLHANILDNILKQDFLIRASSIIRFLVSLMLGTALAIFYFRFAFPGATRMAVLLVIAYIAAQYALYQGAGYALQLVQPIVGIMFAVFGFFGYVIVIKDRDRRLVRDVFLRSVSPRIGEEILKNYHDDAIWGARRTITILFLDVRGYTAMSEQHGADAVLELLDRFYDTASEAVFRHEGQVNKFMGDAVLALFGALPEESPNHAERAVRAAVEIQAAMTQLNHSDFIRRLGIHVETGAGVNTGEATVGLVGRRRIRIEYTALGDAVNIASRLQGLASEGEVVLGEQTLGAIGGPESPVLSSLALTLSEKEFLKVKGKAEPIPAYRARLTAESSERINKTP